MEPLIITEPGVYNIMNEQVYHDDPVVVPSLSRSTGKIMVEETPRHGWLTHPRLNPNFKRKHSDTFDLGNAAHDLMLFGLDKLRVVNADSWRTKAAKAEKALAYAEGTIPILKDKLPEVETMVAAGRAQLALHEDVKDCFSDGVGGQMLVWKEDTPYGEVWCRILLDWIPTDPEKVNFTFPEYKTGGVSCGPSKWARHCFDMGYDYQYAFYRRGIKKILGIDNPRFVFVVHENKPPYALATYTFGQITGRTLDKYAQRMIDTWGYCFHNNHWPGYQNRTLEIEPPVYIEMQRNEREEFEASTYENPADMFEKMIAWQAPIEPDQVNDDEEEAL